MLEEKSKKLLIAAVIPAFLEKREDLFSKNVDEIEKSRRENPFVERHTLIVEIGLQIKLTEFLRQVAELGYSKVWECSHRGEFSQRGGVVYIFPINFDNIFTIEFEGNTIMEITAAPPSSILGVESQKTPSVFPRGATFHPGDYVVHIDHGIGIFRGEQNDDFVIEYAAPKNRPNSPDLLFVPKTEVKRIAPYLGFKKPEIHRLGTAVWSITKRKAKEDIVAFAKELLKILAERTMSYRKPYDSFTELEEELISNFRFEHTQDQQKAIEDVFADMAKTEPMDRIVTGDVGFGKTEVAVLAAFRAVLNKKQVAVLAPTTILADQHADVFSKRLGDFGVEVCRLTRLETQKELKMLFKKIASSRIDIVIGTHKILGGKVKFADLGLLIIDEEQKFGVVHKEKFKKEKPALDILTLSATPIPRTLSMALSGLRRISAIEIPPGGRSGVRTYVLPKNKNIIKDAINFELARSGQVYFLSNRIHKIPKILDEIRLLGIKAQIGILHGRMGEKSIIKTMHEFRDGQIQLLVSTTIIENGLDLSNANTLIVEDSTKLGLSQAHQLRGRIGRGEREAFAYFLYPTQKLKEKAARRLEALERCSWLGAGLELAKQDLEIRGAGNILGKAQSGVAFRIGLNLYFELLEEAVSGLSSQK